MNRLAFSVLPDTWRLVPIGDLADIVYGEALRVDERITTGKIPVYSSGGLIGRHDKALHNGPSIVIGRKGSVGSIYYTPEPFWCIDTAFYLDNVTSLIDIEFLSHVLQFIDLSRLSITVGVPGINRQDVAKQTIPLPPLSEQKRIVTILRHAADLLRQRRESDDLTQKLLLTFFSELFGDPAINPKKWPIMKAGDLMTSCEYGSSQKANETGQGIPIIRMNNVTYDGSLKLNDLKHVVLSNEDYKKYALEPGDVLFNRTNSKELVGKTAMWEGQFEAVPASYFIRARFDRTKEHPLHFVVFMNSPHMKRRLLEMARGAVGQSNINAKELQSIQIPIPPIELQQIFVERVRILSELKNEQMASADKFNKLFDSLLARAFIGELTGSWHEQHKEQLTPEIEQRDEWLKERGVQRAVVTESISIELPPIIDDPLLSQLSPAQQRVYALVQSHSAAYFTLQTLWESQNDEDQHVDRDVLERGLVLFESLGVILRVSVPVAPTGETFYQSAYRRVQVVSNLPPFLNSDFNAQIFFAVLKIKDKSRRADIIGKLAPHLNEEFMSQAFSVIRKDEFINVNAFANLAPHLNAKRKLQALTAAREIENEFPRARVMTALVPHLNEEIKDQVLSEALAAARAIKNETARVQVLVALIPHLNEESKAQVLSEAIAVVREIKEHSTQVVSNLDASPALLQIMEYKEQALSEAIAMTSVIKDEVARTQVLSEAITVAREIKDESDRLDALTALIPYLNKEIKDQVLSEALAAARAIKEESARVRALVALAPHLNNGSKDQVLSEALATAREIKEETGRVRALVTLVPHLNEEYKVQVFLEALRAVHEIKDEKSWSPSLIPFTLRFYEGKNARVFSDLIAVAHEIKNESAYAQVLSEALAVAHEIKDKFARLNAMIILIPHLNEESKAEVLSEALATTRAIKSEFACADALISLIPHLNEEIKAQVVIEALAVIREIKDETARAQSLVALVPYLKEDGKAQVFSEILTLMFKIKNESLRADILETLVPYFNHEFKTPSYFSLATELHALKDRFPNIRL